MKLIRLVFFVGASLALLCGCGSTKTYSASGPSNLVVRSALEARPGLMSSAGAELHIHRIESRCKFEYLGMVRLDEPERRVSLPTDQPVLLVFVIESRSFADRASSVRRDVLVAAQRGYTYAAEVQYLRGIYDVTVRESNPTTGATRVIEARSQPPC